MGFSKQGHWSGLPFPSPGDLPDPGIEPESPALQADSLLSEPPGKLELKVGPFRGSNGNSDRLFWGAPKSLQMVIAAMKLKETCLLEGKL